MVGWLAGLTLVAYYIARGQLRFTTGSARTKGDVMGRAIDNGAPANTLFKCRGRVFSTKCSPPRPGRAGLAEWSNAATSVAAVGRSRVQFLAPRSRSEPRRADLGSQPEVDCGRHMSAAVGVFWIAH